MTPFKRYYPKAREEGAEWYQIFLAEKMTDQVQGDETLFFFLLSFFIKNDEGHLRISLSEEEMNLLESYKELFQGDHSPLLLFDGYLYTRRRKVQEDGFIILLERTIEAAGVPLFKAGVNFSQAHLQAEGEGEHSISPEILKACKLINSQGFFIVTGGPGTGKTTALADILSIFQNLSDLEGTKPLRIALAAPTGRAAKRMDQSLSLRGDYEPAQTLHRLLKINYSTGEARYNRKNPLPADLIIVDEASMVDLRMMTLLFEALSHRTHLLLVGDKNQLPSVEAGALLSDFLEGIDSPKHRLKENVLVLKKVYRSHKEIIELSQKVIEGKEGETMASLRDAGSESLTYGELLGRGELYARLCSHYAHLRPTDKAFSQPISQLDAVKTQIDLWFEYYSRFIILSPTRKGIYGVEMINEEIREKLFPSSLHGIPLMITKNDYDLGLFNGDRGVILLFGGEAHVVFPQTYDHFPLAYLSDWEYSWVQTIHKSQGSEFHEVLVILPDGAERLLSREILYTALTRAKERVSLYGNEETIRTCVSRGVERNSRIKEVLLSGPLPV